MVWVRQLAIRDIRNIRDLTLELHQGLNVFYGRNAQGKTTLLEAVGLLARGRSFRTDHAPSMIRRGAPSLLAGAHAGEAPPGPRLEVELAPGHRTYRLDGREVAPREYQGRLEVVVYSTDRLRTIRGSMRERRQLLDRAAAALWPPYRTELRSFERLLAQRNASLASHGRDLEAWTERFVESGARLRSRRASYAARLTAALADGYRPEAETYEVHAGEVATDEAASRRALEQELRDAFPRERAAGRSLAGPHRDPVAFLLNGRDVADGASSGQTRSLLLALVVACLRVYREETGRAAVALLDDLDSELDEARAGELCAELARRGQALVTTAHAGWAESLREHGHIYHVTGGEVRVA